MGKTHPVARLGDKVKIDCPHGPTIGIIVKGSSHTYTDNKKTARMTDKVICTKCGEKGHIITGSKFTYADGLKIARKTDKTVGTCNGGPDHCKMCPHNRSGKIKNGSPHTYRS